jgi:hypothetical protein
MRALERARTAMSERTLNRQTDAGIRTKRPRAAATDHELSDPVE